MNSFQKALDKATADGIITSDQNWKLAPYFGEKSVPDTTSSDFADLDAPRDRDDQRMTEDSESPRFVRGFHDILITIGVIIVLVGLGSLTDFIFVGLGAWILAEILVKRQRLALPAVVLTLVFAISSLLFVIGSVDQFKQIATKELQVVFETGLFALLLAPFYWRFRVPIALSLMITAALVFVFSITLLVVAELIGIENLFANAPVVVNIIGLISAIALFAIAMMFDLRDRTREKRWSDVAFWLHLITAPILLSSFVSLLLYKEGVVFWWTETPTQSDAVIVVLCVLAMMVVGLLIDRRAFVTSGLISLIAAAVIIFESSDVSWENTTSIALLVVGVIVLTFGIGWQFLRRQVLKIVPSSIVDRLPIIR